MSTRTRSRKPATTAVPAVGENPLRKSVIVKAQSTTVEVPAGSTALIFTPEEMELFVALAQVQDFVPYLQVACKDFRAKAPARGRMQKATFRILDGLTQEALTTISWEMEKAINAVARALKA